MASYTYRCDACGDQDHRFPMGQAPDQLDCPACTTSMRRVVTAPGLALGNGAARRLLDRTAASADAPQVVAAPPARNGAPRQRVTTNPLHSKLPRP